MAAAGANDAIGDDANLAGGANRQPIRSPESPNPHMSTAAHLCAWEGEVKLLSVTERTLVKLAMHCKKQT